MCNMFNAKYKHEPKQTYLGILTRIGAKVDPVLSKV